MDASRFRQRYLELVPDIERYHKDYLDLFLEFPGGYHCTGLCRLLEDLRKSGRMDVERYHMLMGAVNDYNKLHVKGG